MIIIKYYETFIGMKNSVYEKIMDGEHSEVIPRSRALQLIESYDLVPVLKNEYGTVWDTPNQEFKQKYGLMNHAKD